MTKGLEALERIGEQKTKDTSFGITIKTNCAEDYNIIEKELKALDLIKKCIYIGHSGAIALTDYGFEHKEELKEVLLWLKV